MPQVAEPHAHETHKFTLGAGPDVGAPAAVIVVVDLLVWMAAHREHHFVPQFYLRQFSADGRRIGVFNLDRMVVIRGASIRGQCARRDFHGFAPGLEQEISRFEDRVAPVLRELCSSRRVPEPETEERRLLLEYIVLQKLRTLARGRRNDTLTDYLAKIWAQAHGELSKIDPETYEIVSKYPVALSLRQVPTIAREAGDLEIHLFTNDTSTPFIASDDPVVLHNRYCEGINYRGVLGWNCSGIQAFWPISRSELLHVYDSDVYRVGRLHRSHRTTGLTAPGEIRSLNQLQILNAYQNVYFQPGPGDARVESACHSAARLRPKGRTTFVESEEVPDPDGGSSALVHSYERMLPIRLKLGCIGIRKRARRIPLHRRGAPYRKPLPNLGEDEDVYPRNRASVRYPVKRSFDR